MQRMKRSLLPQSLPELKASPLAHPLGYEMPIAEGGRSLSGGQKQAIGLARVLIRRPKILFLDEPTAHFDVRSEAEFLERLKGLADGKMTIIVSTHRLSLLSLVDRLLLFDQGQARRRWPSRQGAWPCCRAMRTSRWPVRGAASSDPSRPPHLCRRRHRCQASVKTSVAI